MQDGTGQEFLVQPVHEGPRSPTRMTAPNVKTGGHQGAFVATYPNSRRHAASPSQGPRMTSRRGAIWRPADRSDLMERPRQTATKASRRKKLESMMSNVQ